MHLLGLWFLLLVSEFPAFSESATWNFKHPKTLYAWEGACIWIPCGYTNPKPREHLENLVVYQNPEYDPTTKNFKGTVLYNHTKAGGLPSQQGRVQFLGDLQNNCTLSLSPVHANDSGHLGLRVTSKTDKWMEEINLNVSATPLVPRIQLPPEIEASQEVTLTCSLSFACFGYPIKLQWSLEEPAITSTTLSPETVVTQSKLTFRPQWTHHGKNVTCQLVTGTEGQVLSEQTVRLEVKYVPQVEIEVSPSDATVIEGESVTMTCRIVSSNPQYKSISWFKDGMQLSASKTLTLTLPQTSKEMSGKYLCRASNTVGRGNSKEVTLQVQYAPEPSSVLIHQSPAKEGATVEMICQSPANPHPTNYTWYHDGKELLGKTEEKFYIPQVSLQHAGTYSCVAENRLGIGQMGPETELDVQYPPKEVTTVIRSPLPIREGDRVTLFCNYNSSNPQVTRYEWVPKGPWIEPSPGVLLIQKVAWDTTSIYCAACNQWCSWALPTHLNVQYAPRDVRVLVIGTHSEIHSRHRVQLQCKFSTSHPPVIRYVWKKNGSFLKEGSELIFDSITPEDAGNYSCTVDNSIGETTSKASILQVLYPPRRLRVSIAPGDSVMEGRKAALTCESDANPPASQFTWFDWNNQNLHHAGQTLRLEPAKVQDSGVYRCQGANRLGMGESPPSTLTVYYSPETIGRRAAVAIGICLAILLLTIWGFKIRRSWKRIRSQQGLQENSSGQSFFVRNKKIRRPPLSEGPQSLGCYNPVMEDGVSYATLQFPETSTPRTGDAGISERQGPPANRNDTVTYSVLQKPRVVDYENVTPNFPEDEEIHYSELVQFGVGERPRTQESVEYVTLKH
ncbi:B-cell receptor CD22 isoform X1 [Tupaia chinensis]|uniref:B-cell receptor CD22 isoform X1 n=1 Tax=Tupaia chinensis TaxID=246437 RepID=UPI0003C91085|nr:B-cell receptor CD22 isoform X1 [Tupaia chinensis]XP_027625305.1 B-cell receptor CD22 isoform X1 [Tupaia chinensis]XP_027625306.1 B-cell receptor CD22 isoform X1 [Tupaia chinensis]XP_027625307.1 B-cell receptor CD22 isoform X1 [Tupaia chinensis]